MKKIIGKVVAIIIVFVLVGSIVYWKSLPEKDVSMEMVYTEEYQNEIADELESKKSLNDYDEDHMLIKYNPFKTNTLSLYVYFNTEEDTKVSYTVKAPETSYEDFSVSVDATYQKEHEFQVLGLIPDALNQVEFTIENENGNTITRTYEYTMSSLLGDEDVQLEEMNSTVDSVDIGNGLFAFMGNDSDEQDFMYYYDENGVIRAEIPILGYRSHRLLFQDDLMYFSIAENKMAAMNGLGQIEKIYDLNQYELHHDYVFDNDGNILILASDTESDTVEDRIILLDTETGEVSEVLDLEDLFSSYKEMTTHEEDEDWDWMHINTLQWLEDGSAILSSRETSTIIKINDLETNPSIDYLIGEESFWNNTEYADYLLTQTSEFANAGGQHSVTYMKDDSLEEGQYYLYLFNNNYGVSTTRSDYDWTQIEGIETKLAKEGDTDVDSVSYFYQYLVDENKGTYSLVQFFEIPYSGIVSSVQRVNDYIITDSGMQGVLGIYDAQGNLLKQYKSMLNKKYIYRIYYYDFDGFYFNI